MHRILAMWAAVLVAAPVLLAGTVTLKASSVEAQPGGKAAVAIDVSGGEGIGAMHVELSYDAAVLSVEGVDAGSVLEGAMLKANHETPGRVVLSIATAKSVKGSGPLATVRFKVNGAGGAESAITLEKCKAWSDDESDVPLPLSVVDGRLRVAGAAPKGPDGSGPKQAESRGGLAGYWLPIGIGAAALAVLLLGIAMRGKKAGGSCPHCGAPLSADAQFCAKCGKPRAATAVCPKCGATLQGDSRFCAKCGTPRS